jgi:hypothetical protein
MKGITIRGNEYACVGCPSKHPFHGVGPDQESWDGDDVTPYSLWLKYGIIPNKLAQQDKTAQILVWLIPPYCKIRNGVVY